MSRPEFELERRLAADTFFVRRLKLCRMMLLNDSRWAWLVLVPERRGIVEIFDLAPEDRALLMEEVAFSADLLKQRFAAEKINFGSLGNIVPQFHMHVIARHARDAAWPDAPWGVPGRQPYDPDVVDKVLGKLDAEDPSA